jgi:hypothetical protein
LPAIAEQILRDDRDLVELTSRNDFSVDMLAAGLRKAVDGCR